METAKPEHTRGPWTVGMEESDKVVEGASSQKWFELFGNGGLIALVNTWDQSSSKRTRDQAMANAALLAAAPELLAALLSLRKAFYVDGNSKALKTAFEATHELAKRFT